VLQITPRIYTQFNIGYQLLHPGSGWFMTGNM